MAMAQLTTAPCRQKDMTRRNFLVVLPLAGALAVPASAKTESNSIFHKTYRAWEEARRAYDHRPGEAAYARLISIEDAMSALHPSTVEDFAFKILVADNGGDMNTNPHQLALVSEARRITGVSA